MESPMQEAGQSPRQDYVSTPMSTETMQLPGTAPSFSPQSSPEKEKPSSPSASPQVQGVQPQPPSCDCAYYHNQGLGCPCGTRYAIKVGRKATDRILTRSKFFTDSNAHVVLLNEKNKGGNALDESNHSTFNQILQLDPGNLTLGKLLGKGGFCVVYEASLPSHLANQIGCGGAGSEMHMDDDVEDDKDENEDEDDTNDMHIHDSGDNNNERGLGTGTANDKHESSDCNSNSDNNNNNTRNNQHYCVKFLKPSVLPDRKKFARGIADLAIEAHFLASLNHPHILKIRGVSESFELFDPISPSYLSDLTHEPGLDGRCFLLLDQLAITLDKKITLDWKETQNKWNSFLNRTVYDIRGVKRKMFRLERITVALQLAQAMQYLHQHNICYRDLKPDNIGFDVHDSLKLFDFGLAKELKEYKRHVDGTYQLTANTGSKRYMAPEVASRARYNLSVDVFSYGILFWEICSLEKPFDGFTEVQHMNLVVQRGHRPKLDTIKNWPLSIRHIISRCWHPISNERPTFQQVVGALIQVRSDMSEN